MTNVVKTLALWTILCLAYTDCLEITTVQVLGPSSVVAECSDVTLVCQATPCNATLWWSFRGVNLTGGFTSPCPADELEAAVADAGNTVDMSMMSDDPQWQGVESTLPLNCTQVADAGNYTCHAADPDGGEAKSQSVELLVKVPLEVMAANGTEGKVGSQAMLTCLFRGYPFSELEWKRNGKTVATKKDKYKVAERNISETEMELALRVEGLNRKDNGSYQCIARNAREKIGAAVNLFVLDKPQVSVDFAKAVGANRIYLNWTVDTGNSPILHYFIQIMKNGSNSWTHYREPIPGRKTSYVLKFLEPNTTYHLRLQAKNDIGTGDAYTIPHPVTTLDKDPQFNPVILVKGVTSESISVSWSSPPVELHEYIHYYQLALRRNQSQSEAIHHASHNESNLHLFADLSPATIYFFKLAACNEWTKQCGKWSNEVNGTTLDGVAGPPHNVSAMCKFDNISRTSFVYASWDSPLQPHGKIIHYNVVLQGLANFRGANGRPEDVTWGPKIRNVDGQERSARFDVVPSNTNYTVQVCGVTRSRKCGNVAHVRCPMPPTVPEREQLTKFNWSRAEVHGRWVFRLHVPRLSERNGPICCYRVVLVRMQPSQNVADLPSPDEMNISTYDEVHRHRHSWGAYVAEMFESDILNQQVVLGDGYSSPGPQCEECLPAVVAPASVPVPTVTATLTPSTPSPEILTTESPAPLPSPSPLLSGNKVTFVRSARNRRNLDQSEASQGSEVGRAVEDGALYTDSNYTGFVEVIVLSGEGTPLKAHSSYFSPLVPGPTMVPADDSSILVFVTGSVLCGLFILVLVVLLLFCLLRRSKRIAGDAERTEMALGTSLRSDFRTLCRTLRGRHMLVPSAPPDLPPISKENLVDAYVERHRDSDYGFQQEFELLPDRFPDRTTRASDARESLGKNRYPDIKAYDQTRVKLSAVPGNPCSDYVNANFVVGYKERKRFICAQGPMETTTTDFWRLVWEQGVELILMLTNLEEYNKSKCAKYWPDEGTTASHGDLTISYVTEKRYSDYVVRELKVAKNRPVTNGPTPNSIPSSPAAADDDKKVLDPASDSNSSSPISPHSESSSKEERTLTQYHFLVWKDFMAPEHPAGILRFVKRVNEVNETNQGPILIHCSAGVGRTGTLVALDSLLQQLAEESQVAIFNTICDLRHQRNYLVQSLKQYIFVYRALMEMSQFGDTEVEISQLKSVADKLRQKINGKERCDMEEEFIKLSQVLEDRKSFSVGSGEENKQKNRYESVIPYDRNRVILTPMALREHSTYINASFVEGYDNSESFVIAQDPLETTMGDFWRMLAEQGVSTLVMLSDLGEGENKCPRYWPEPDNEATYEHIRVRYLQSESCPYYTWREFAVTNTKTDDSVITTQFQYHGWPTGDGEVPEVTRGLVDLVSKTQSNQEAHVGSGPIVVHCSNGADRSGIFVGLSILTQQIQTESRTDVFTVARKLRSQRQGILRNFAQYEFLYRAAITYVELHKLLDDE